MTKPQRIRDFDPEFDVRLWDDDNDGDAAVFDRTYVLGVGENFNWPTVHKWTGKLFDMFTPGGPLCPHYGDDKMAGHWFLSGITIPQANASKPSREFAHKGYAERDNIKMDSAYLMLFDFDQGYSINDVVAPFVEKGIACVVYTTHSHGKTYSDDATPKNIEAYMKKTGIEDIEEAISEFYLNTKKYAQPIVNSMKIETKWITGDDGRQHYPVFHDPMPKYRVVCFLKEPFQFQREGEQIPIHDTISAWKKTYKRMAAALGGSTADSTCSNPARLFFGPQFRSGTVLGDIWKGDHGIGYVGGGFLDPKAVMKGDALGNVEAQMPGGMNYVEDEKGQVSQFVTPNLLAFYMKHKHDFHLVDMLRDTLGDRIIVRDIEQDKVEIRCPDDDLHSTPDRTDSSAAFAAQSGSDGDGWWIGCGTDGCQGRYVNQWGGFDKLAYLDRIIQEHGIVKDAWELEEWCDERTREDDGTIAGLLSQITGDTKLNDPLLTQAIEEIIALDDEVESAALEIELTSKFGYGVKGKVNQLFKAAVKRKAKAAKQAKKLDVPDPGDVDTDAKKLTLYDAHGPHEMMRQLENWIIKQETGDSPNLFVRTNGDYARVAEMKNGTVRIERMMDKHLQAYVAARVAVVSENAKGETKTGLPNQQIVSHVWHGGGVQRQLYHLAAVSSFPKYGPNGTLITKKGYDAETEEYFLPTEEYRDASRVPTAEELDDAIGILYLALRDFPFWDDYTGTVADIPIYDYDDPVEDAPGFFHPNLKRGHSSRLSAISLILTAFVKNMIHGPCPMFLIDKPTANTGATMLLKLFSYIFDGYSVTMRDFPSANRDGEMQKAMLPMLRDGAPMLAFDNISHHTKIDDPFVAGVITSGRFAGRVLGESEEEVAILRSIFVLAGNNVAASSEIMRRIVPCRLDAQSSKPGERRALFDMDQWAAENRADLVWAVHIIVNHWIAQGMPRYSGAHGANLATFHQWRDIVGGIIETAGMDPDNHFLAVYDHFIGEKMDSYSSDGDLIKFLWETYRHHDFLFGATDFHQDMYGMSDMPQVENFELVTRDKRPTPSSCGRTLKTMVGKTYNLVGTEVKIATARGGKYRLVPVAEGVDLNALVVT